MMNRHVLIQQHAYTHRLQTRYHANGIVIAQYAVHIPLEMATHLSHPVHRGFKRSEGIGPEIPRQDAEIVIHFTHHFYEDVRKIRSHIEVKVRHL